MAPRRAAETPPADQAVKRGPKNNDHDAPADNKKAPQRGAFARQVQVGRYGSIRTFFSRSH